jgi:FkbM family methyltransferase
MIFITSFAPGESFVERQTKALSSWKKLGVKVVSLNSIDDIKKLTGLYDVEFVSTENTSEHIFKKPYVKINALLDYGGSQNESDIICLINSDIELLHNAEIISTIESKAAEGLVLASRYNYIEQHSDSMLEPYGIDIFAMHKKFTSIFPKTVFSMGQCAWDYWVPLHFMKNKLPIHHILSPVSFHKRHDLNWDLNGWSDVWRLLLDEKLFHPETISTKVHQNIMDYGTDVLINTGRRIHPAITYLLHHIEKPIIFEIGANTGQDTYILSNIRGSVVHAFECDEKNELHSLDNVIVNRHAISDKEGELEFNRSSNSESGSIKNPKNHLTKYAHITFGEKIKVKSTTLDIYCKKNNIDAIDFLWCDIQGAEEEMILGGTEILPKTKYIYTEYSNDEMYECQITLKRILELLPDFEVIGYFDFDNVLLRNKTWRESEELKNNPKEDNTMEEIMITGTGKKLQTSVNKLTKQGWNIKSMNPRKQPMFSVNDVENMDELVEAMTEGKPLLAKLKPGVSIQNVSAHYEYMEVILTKD